MDARGDRGALRRRGRTGTGSASHRTRRLRTTEHVAPPRAPMPGVFQPPVCERRARAPSAPCPALCRLRPLLLRGARVGPLPALRPRLRRLRVRGLRPTERLCGPDRSEMHHVRKRTDCPRGIAALLPAWTLREATAALSTHG